MPIEPGAFPFKRLPDGRIAEVIPLTLDRARLVVSTPEDYGETYVDGW